MTATRPARVPFSIMLRSGLPRAIQAVAVAVRHPAAAAMLVLSATAVMPATSAAMVLPGLKPNQPSQRMSVPRVAKPMLWPGIGWTRPSLPNLPEARPEDEDAGERRPAADAVHRRRAGEVAEELLLALGRDGEEAAAPDPVAGDRVDRRPPGRRRRR